MRLDKNSIMQVHTAGAAKSSKTWQDPTNLLVHPYQRCAQQAQSLTTNEMISAAASCGIGNTARTLIHHHQHAKSLHLCIAHHLYSCKCVV